MNTVLISSDELAAALTQAQPPVVIDVRWYLTDADRGLQEYLAGHIPGSAFIAVEHELSAPVAADGAGGRHPLPSTEVFEQALRRAGVCDDSQVVVLDQGPSLAAGRLWWMLRDAGIDRVRVLNGGFAAWQAAGLPIESGESVVRQGSVTLRPGQLPRVDAAAVVDHLAAGGRVVDVRAAERFAGEVEPIDPVAGHIPGAINLPASEVQSGDGFLPVELIAERLDQLQAGDVVSCGSGITAAQLIVAAEAAGVTGLRLYAGSWSDWISDPTRPVATGR